VMCPDMLIVSALAPAPCGGPSAEQSAEPPSVFFGRAPRRLRLNTVRHLASPPPRSSLASSFHSHQGGRASGLSELSSAWAAARTWAGSGDRRRAVFGAVRGVVRGAHWRAAPTPSTAHSAPTRFRSFLAHTGPPPATSHGWRGVSSLFRTRRREGCRKDLGAVARRSGSQLAALSGSLARWSSRQRRSCPRPRGATSHHGDALADAERR
jgi:hypothetical protein